MRRILAVISFLLATGVVITAAGLSWALHSYARQGPLATETYVVIESGRGVAAIAGDLERAGIIADPLLFRIAARLGGYDTKLQAGEYRFAASVSMKDVLADLAAGRIYQRRFTVPEGLTSWQIVELLNGIDELSGEIAVIPPEGSLLPETYNFARGETRQEKIERMQEAMRAVLAELVAAKPATAPLLTDAEVIILASIVEKETAVAAERRRVAGVFINRLKLGMKLQTDPTVIYAITQGKIKDDGKGPLGRRLLSADLQYESPYNTYKYPGLPPGPIANPGRESIAAVLDPEAHDYLFFVADGKGGHVFAKTLDEHNANVARWREIRNAPARQEN